MTLDEVLKSLMKIEKKLISIKQKRIEVENLKKHLFEGAELNFNISDKKKTIPKKIAEIAYRYLTQYGNASSHDIACYLNVVSPELLMGRANTAYAHVIAVSQALGSERSIFKTDRRIGWTLIDARNNP